MLDDFAGAGQDLSFLLTRGVRDAYRVQQANIYVTQQLVRMVILQYREEVQPKAAKYVVDSVGTQNSLADEREEVVGSLLAILERIPQNIAGG